MPIVYRIYSNGGSGGPIDYSTPIASVATTTFTTGPLSAPGDYRFGVHACNSSTGIEELNTQASLRISLDANGNDTGQGPNVPFALVTRPTANGGCRVSWGYQPRGQAAAPKTFAVYLTPGLTPDLTTPAASVAYVPGQPSFGCQLSGLADGATYTVSVASVPAGGRPTSSVVSTTVVGDSTPPMDVDALIVGAIP